MIVVVTKIKVIMSIPRLFDIMVLIKTKPTFSNICRPLNIQIPNIVRPKSKLPHSCLS